MTFRFYHSTFSFLKWRQHIFKKHLRFCLVNNLPLLIPNLADMMSCMKYLTFAALVSTVRSFSLISSSSKHPSKFGIKMMADIVDTAVSAGSFKTLAAALTAAGLVPTLKSAGPFTVFAPTDEAFAKLPAGTVEALLKDIPQLSSILTYHCVSGKVLAETVVTLDGKEVKTVNGADVKISVPLCFSILCI